MVSPIAPLDVLIVVFISVDQVVIFANAVMSIDLVFTLYSSLLLHSVIFFIHPTNAATTTVRIGGLLRANSDQETSVLKWVIEAHNKNRYAKFRLEPIWQQVTSVPVDDLQVIQHISRLQSNGVVAIISNFEPSAVVSAYIEQVQLPLFHTGFPRQNTSFQLSMKPSYLTAIKQLIATYGWDRFVYLYESNAAIESRLNVLLTNPSVQLKYIKKISNKSEADAALNYNQQTDTAFEKYVILDCNAALAQEIVINHIQNVYMGKRNYHFLVTELTLEEPWSQKILEAKSVLVSGFRILSPENQDLITFSQTWRQLDKRHFPGSDVELTTNAALVYDAGQALVSTIERIMNKRSDTSWLPTPTPQLECIRVTADQHSKTDVLMRNLRKITLSQGITGVVAFNETTTERANITLDVIKLNPNGIAEKTFEWTSQSGLTRPDADISRTGASIDYIDDPNRVYLITTILEEPWLMLRNEEDGMLYYGNDRFEGFYKDVADLIANHLGIRYELKLVKDNKFGGIDSTASGGWNGMIGELVRNEADIALANMAITSARQRVVEFTHPLLSTGLSIMVKKPIKMRPGIFAILQGFPVEIWASIGVAYLVVSLVLFAVGQLSPLELKPTGSRNKFSLCNSFWYALQLITLQHCDAIPKSFGVRVVITVWWIFAVILMSTLLLNLPAYLTVEKIVS